MATYRRRSVWRSISIRLTALFVVLVTALLAVSCGYWYWQSLVQLRQDDRRDRESLRDRLRINLQSPVWNLDAPVLDQNLSAEVKGPVRGIVVHDLSGRLLALKGELPGTRGLEQFEFPLVYNQSGVDQAIGTVTVGWSDAGARKTLNTQFWWRVTDILVLDVVLVSALWLSLRALVFRPLSELRQALERAADVHDQEQEIALRGYHDDEFGEVVREFNRIARRLADDLDRRRQAENEIRGAYDNLRNAQDSLVRSEKLAALGRLVAGVAHELNTPIGNSLLSASTFAEHTESFAGQALSGTLRRSVLETYVAQSREAAGILLSNLHKAADLIASFKQVSADQASSQRRSFELDRVVEECLIAHRPTLRKTPISVSAAVPPGIRMDSYPGPLGQVIANLINNAVTHGHEGAERGSVEISARAAGAGSVELIVRDDGCGIAEDDLKRVFDPFYTTKLGRGGTGLGLPICHRIVTEILGGTITVESRTGAGTRITMRLPLTAPAGHAAPAEAVAGAHSRAA